jgi:hypothetical protein
MIGIRLRNRVFRKKLGFRIDKMKKRIPQLLISLLIALASIATLHTQLTHAASNPPTRQWVWLISGSTTPDPAYSSPYGPRLKASENFRYDYHQGIDIPTPLNTVLHAVSTGTVRIAGSHPQYSDGVVQIDHGDNIYSNYLHITASLVTTGQVVNMGQPVALSGASESGFAHVHFEIRDGSVFRRDTINPFRYLPYSNTLSHTIAITQITPHDSVWVQVTAPPLELDINQISITVRSLITPALTVSRLLDYEARNLAYLGNPAILDDETLDDMLVQPAPFNINSDQYGVAVQFQNLPNVGNAVVEACVVDVMGGEKCRQKAYFQFPIIPGTP